MYFNAFLKKLHRARIKIFTLQNFRFCFTFGTPCIANADIMSFHIVLSVMIINAVFLGSGNKFLHFYSSHYLLRVYAQLECLSERINSLIVLSWQIRNPINLVIFQGQLFFLTKVKKNRNMSCVFQLTSCLLAHSSVCFSHLVRTGGVKQWMSGEECN